MHWILVTLNRAATTNVSIDAVVAPSICVSEMPSILHPRTRWFYSRDTSAMLAHSQLQTRPSTVRSPQQMPHRHADLSPAILWPFDKKSYEMLSSFSYQQITPLPHHDYAEWPTILWVCRFDELVLTLNTQIVPMPSLSTGHCTVLQCYPSCMPLAQAMT